MLVEWVLQGKKGEEVDHYVGKVLAVEEAEERKVYSIDFLQAKDHFTRDTFMFPKERDVATVEARRVLGVLSQNKGTTKRQATLIKIFPPLTSRFNLK